MTPEESPVAPDAGLNPVVAGTTVERTPVGDRMQFLDALRGFAAMCVVVQHVLEQLSPGWSKFSLERFRLGEYGVIVFFLCSGFIIPASIERQGSQMRFWVGRLFRLYPLYLAVLAAVLVLHYGFDAYDLPPAYLERPVRATIVNATMLQNFLGQPLALGQSWSLAYEMVFYGLVSAMFVGGLHRRSPLWASLAFGLAMVVNTRHIPVDALRFWNQNGGMRVPVVFAVALVVGVGLIGFVTWNKGPQRWLSMSVVAVSIVLVLNRPNEPLSQAMFFFGTLFFGTCLYRYVTGELARSTVALIGGVGALAIVVSWVTADVYWAPLPLGVTVRAYKSAEIATYLAGYATFLLALRFRRIRFPAIVLWFGTISYSLYLVHVIPLHTIGRITENNVADGAIWILASIAISAGTYYGIEKPAVVVGRHASRRAAGRWSRPGL